MSSLFLKLLKNTNSTSFASPPSSQPTTFTQAFSDPYYRGRVRNKKQRLSVVDNNRDSITSFNRSAHIPRSDDGLGSESRSFFSDDESQGFRGSTGFRYGETKSEGHVSRLAHNSIRTRKAAAQLSSPPPSLNRRPLYHCIRNKTSASQSTFDCGVVPEITSMPRINPQLGASRLAWQFTETFPAFVDELAFSPPIPSIPPFSKKGFSLSGEIEQRMNLARVLHDGQFAFHESKPRKRDRIMRGLRRSFKSFFNSKVDR